MYRCSHEAVLERLCDRHTVFYQRPGNGKARCARFQADDVAIADAGSRKQVLDRQVKLVKAPGFGFDAGNRAREFSVRRVVGIRDHLHRRHHIDRQVHRFGTGRRIGDVRGIHQPSTLRGARAFHIDTPVWPSHHTWDQGQQALDFFVGIRGALHRRLRDRGGLRGLRGDRGHRGVRRSHRH